MDIHPGIWKALRDLGESKRAFMPREAYEELLRFDDECAPWCKSIPGFVVDANEAEVRIVSAITAAHPDWVVEQQNAADPWLVAHGKIHNRIVVTEESKKGPNTADRNLKIPNVCAELGVSSLNLNSLARKEGWRF